MNVDQRTLNNLSLCSGGAGLDLGLELALGGLRTVCWVEWEAFAIEYLAAAMEAGCLATAPIYTDLRTFDGRPWRGIVDCLTAGYPCQPFSLCGKRRGQDDPRHLWPHVHRVISEVEPAIVFLENVPGHLSLGFAEVAGDLEGLDYCVTCGLVSAEEVGASHKRERLFILAVANDQSQRWREGRAESAGREGQSVSADAGGAVGNSGGLFQGRRTIPRREADRGVAPAGAGKDVVDAARGGAEPAQQSGRLCGIEPASTTVADAECPERRPDGSRTTDGGRQESQRAEGSETAGTDSGTLAHAADDHRRRGVGGTEEGVGSGELGRRRSASSGEDMADAPELGLQVGASDGCDVQQELAPIERSGLPLFPPSPRETESWRKVLEIDPTLEPAICNVADGMASHRLRLLGNGVVPLQAAYAFISLWSVVQHRETP